MPQNDLPSSFFHLLEILVRRVAEELEVHPVELVQLSDLVLVQLLHAEVSVAVVAVVKKSKEQNWERSLCTSSTARSSMVYLSLNRRLATVF